MGKASRRKRERWVAADRPRWAGADGFDYAWRLADSYVAAGDALARAAAGQFSEAGAGVMDALNLRLSLLEGKSSTAKAYADALSDRLGESRTSTAVTPPPNAALPGRAEPFDESKALEMIRSYLAYGEALSCLATGHQDALRRSTPILFDPLSTPAVEGDVADGLRLPFGSVTCDFLTAQGMSMPIQASSALKKSEWVGLVAATLEQQGDDVIDVWPVVKVLSASRPDDAQTGKCLLFGRVRFGAELDEPPMGLRRMAVDGVSVWTITDHEDEANDEHDALWAALWLVLPARAAMAALRLLEAVNVALAPAELPRAELRRAGRVGAEIPLEVVIRTSRKDSVHAVSTSSIDWQHRWTVRGHWKHFTKGPVFNANPRKRVHDAQGNECVKVWCPPFVKGPDDKPLVLKARRMDQQREPLEV